MNLLGFLFNCDEHSQKLPDELYCKEYEHLYKKGVRTYLFDIASILEKNEVFLERSTIRVYLIYRGRMISAQQYQKLYDLLLEKNFQLIITPKQYRESHYLDRWYPKLRDLTVRSYFSDGIPTDKEIKELLLKFGTKSVIVKDYVKALNYEWYESCFIEDASNEHEALKVISNFIEQQGDNFSDGLVLREYIDLKKDSKHFKNGNSTSEEIRIFCFGKEPFCFISYWSGGAALRDKNFIKIIDQCASLNSPFYTLDLAKKKDGNWVLIDVGDGQVSNLRGYNIEKFYDCFLSVLNRLYVVY
jgi:hypothetical protein